MSGETLQILDISMQVALWGFLACFFLLALFVLSRLKQKSQTLNRHFEQLEEERKLHQSDDTRTPEAPSHYQSRPDRLRPLMNSMLISLVVAGLAFLIAAFAPLPFLHNFATEANLGETPLRLTSLHFERSYDGFSLQAEVWNQQEVPVEKLTAVVTVWNKDGERLAEVSTAVKPERLESGKAGRFEMSYQENSPFIDGYQVRFEDAEGVVIEHVEGFDVR